MKSQKYAMGILAHVDAGKTTLAESILYACGKIRSMGRVDHGDAFLDHELLERERGITIFSKQAEISLGDKEITLLDTPGHVDFSAEMERTLQVLDYAILLVSGTDGVQGHVETLWKLLNQYEIPVFIFVNKMDQVGSDQEALMKELQERLDEHCVDFTQEVSFQEAVAMCSELLMEEYIEKEELARESIQEAIAKREVIPCYFGSALKNYGVEELLQGVGRYMTPMDYPEEFGARVFKIARDIQGTRLTYLKVTGGSLKVKEFLNNRKSATKDSEIFEEKVNQIRVYDGAKYSVVDEMTAGGICAVTGCTRTFAGQGLGCEMENGKPLLEPVLTYQILLPDECDPIVVLGQLKQLEEEDPKLHLVWKEEYREIHVQVMGDIQIEILKSLIYERFHIEVSFDEGSIVYKETLSEPTVGIGHFEPLRHYAEVQLLLEPAEAGSGLQFASMCSEDLLDKNWQRLIMTHLEERIHPGVLTGSEITDLRIVLLAGKAHVKHTEGGDFRQATYRAVRQGMRCGQSILLEPVFAFTLELPTPLLGRAMSDVQRMHGRFETPVTQGERSILVGCAPVACMRGYQREVNMYTRGLGKFSCTLHGYEPCHNAEEVIRNRAYHPEEDLQNPTGSVFCAHGAGFMVDWNEVPQYAHLENRWSITKQEEELEIARERDIRDRSSRSEYITQEEIDEIFQRTYGKKPKERQPYKKHHRNTFEMPEVGMTSSVKVRKNIETQTKKESYFLVDGYNIIFAWEELRELASRNIDSARDRLMDIMCNYQGYLGCVLILVFDAYKVKGNLGSVTSYHNIYVVYTKEAETADQYIEKTVHKIGHDYQVTVATSDALEQMIIWGDGAMRMSALGLKDAVEKAGEELREKYAVRSL